MYTIPLLPIDEFDWITWLNGSDIWTKVGFHPRWFSIIENRELLRQYAVGYLPGYRLFCRPSISEVAVMFLIDDVFGWTHLRQEEFERLFYVE